MSAEWQHPIDTQEDVRLNPAPVFIKWQYFHTSYTGTSAYINNMKAKIVKDTYRIPMKIEVLFFFIHFHKSVSVLAEITGHQP